MAKHTLELDDDCVVVVLKCAGEDRFGAELYNFSETDINDDEDMIFLHVMARGMLHIAVNDMEGVIDAGQESMLAQAQDVVDDEPAEDRFNEPNVIDLAAIRPKGRA